MNKSKLLRILSIVVILGAAVAAAVVYFKAKFKKTVD